MKILAVDYGDARTGVAISDLLCTLVGSTTVLPSRNEEKLLLDIVRLTKENGVGTIVVGLPRNMDGTEGPRAALYREFAASLEEATGMPVRLWDERRTTVCRAFAEKVKAATGVDVEMWDERRTTVEAHQILSDHNYHGKKRKNTVDAVAASLILEGYLAYRRR